MEDFEEQEERVFLSVEVEGNRFHDCCWRIKEKIPKVSDKWPFLLFLLAILAYLGLLAIIFFWKG